MSLSELLTVDGLELLDSLPPYNPANVMALSEQLQREGYAPGLVAEALTQSRLRERAADKFGPFAQRMVFTKDGLEQATRLSVGAFHAQRFLETGATHVIDFGAGLGADSMAFAGLGLRVTAIEMDDVAAAAATHNLRPFPEVEVIHADGFSVDLAALDADAIWIDPARRLNGRRLKNPADWMPSLHDAVALARHFPAAGIKVGPGIDYAQLPEDALVEWISAGGDLVEAVIWLGSCAPEPGRHALAVGATSGAARWDSGVSDPRLPATQVIPDALGLVIYEPDPAIIRSGSIATLCEKYGISPVADGIAYLTGNEIIDSPFLTNFTVATTLPLEPKPIRRALRELGVGRVEIKKRGTDLDPEKFRKKLKLDPKLPGEMTLIATPTISGKHRAILCERA
ncbi:class I SAM-dependent methyltransferase [Trueperella bialowiezensis]|uniref:Dimethyladenosine transferase (rRNA methylation) n=1 Tax=Trueperella bialowiezensis TaxID=312285 RepID=A0A448PCY9_9ACTO|nr:class I SAM-dependent methyltransferase [Trueperella bialowiezensis]VEI12797.1 Dimethyladenosine transferase (rRNA methylation) [Trueperella bialowiezensis]